MPKQIEQIAPAASLCPTNMVPPFVLTLQAVPLLLSVFELLLFFLVLAAITGCLLFLVSCSHTMRLTRLQLGC